MGTYSKPSLLLLPSTGSLHDNDAVLANSASYNELEAITVNSTPENHGAAFVVVLVGQRSRVGHLLSTAQSM